MVPMVSFQHSLTSRENGNLSGSSKIFRGIALTPISRHKSRMMSSGLSGQIEGHGGNKKAAFEKKEEPDRPSGSGLLGFLILPHPSRLVSSSSDIRWRMRLFLPSKKAKLDRSIPSTFIGIDNYLCLFSDPGFLRSIWNSLRFTLIAVPIEGVFGLLFGLLSCQFSLQRKVDLAVCNPGPMGGTLGCHLRDLAMVVSRCLRAHQLCADQPWAKVFHLEFFFRGNSLARPSPDGNVGDCSSGCLANPRRMFAIILLAGLQLVPRELYDAATIDGATTWKRFWHITLPDPGSNPCSFALILRTVDAFRMFDLVCGL